MLVIQSRPALWDTMDCSPPGSSVHRIRMDKNIGMGCRSLLQGIFPTQGLNPSLLHCRWILYRLSHQGSLLVNNNSSSCFLSVYWGSSIFRAFTGTISPCNNPGPQVLLQLPFDGKEKQSTEHCQQGRATHLLTGTTGINTQAGGSRPHTMPSATSPLQGETWTVTLNTTLGHPSWRLRSLILRQTDRWVWCTPYLSTHSPGRAHVCLW